MTPVEDVNIELVGIFNSLEMASQIFDTDFSPYEPVNALELPELTNIAIGELLELIFSFFWQSNTLTGEFYWRCIYTFK